MNALELLKQDHQKVKGLFQEIRKSSDRSRQKELFDKIDTELEMHTHIEETTFIPRLKNRKNSRTWLRKPSKSINKLRSFFSSWKSSELTTMILVPSCNN